MNKPMAPGTDTERTAPHRRVERCLDDMGISYMSEKPFMPYTVDVYLPEWHLAIEFDGPYHSQKNDEVRDRWLLDWFGLRVMRITRRWSLDKLKVLIVEFIEAQCDEVEERKELWRSHG